MTEEEEEEVFEKESRRPFEIRGAARTDQRAEQSMGGVTIYAIPFSLGFVVHIGRGAFDFRVRVWGGAMNRSDVERVRRKAELGIGTGVSP